MSLKKYGLLTTARQSGAELSYRSDGLIEGQIAYAVDLPGSLVAAKALIGTVHPDDPAVTLYAGKLSYLKLHKGLFTYDCIGLGSDPTARVIQGRPQVSTTAIEAHPKFTDTLAGTADAPLHAAVFDDDGNFLQFGSGPLLGTSSFYDGSVTIRASYYTRRAPTFSELFKLTSALPGIPHIAGISQWLYFPPEFEQIPNTGIFKVCEEFVGVQAGGAESASLLYGS